MRSPFQPDTHRSSTPAAAFTRAALMPRLTHMLMRTCDREHADNRQQPAQGWMPREQSKSSRKERAHHRRWRHADDHPPLHAGRRAAAAAAAAIAALGAARVREPRATAAAQLWHSRLRRSALRLRLVRRCELAEREHRVGEERGQAALERLLGAAAEQLREEVEVRRRHALRNGRCRRTQWTPEHDADPHPQQQDTMCGFFVHFTADVYCPGRTQPHQLDG
jgi:hypothetical protein